MTVHSDKLAAVNIDGECEMVNDSTFEIIPDALTFVLPTTSTYLADKESGKLNNIIGTKVE